MKSKSVAIGDTEMYYVSFGKGERNLVVLPGLSDGLATVKDKGMMLSAPYKRFLNDFTVYMFSRKNKMPEGYSIRDMAADQALAMKELGVERFSVMGVSQGGMIAQYLAADYPEMVDKLILTVTCAYANDTITEVASAWIDMAKRGDQVELMVDTANKMYSEEYLKKYGHLFPLIARITKPKDGYERFFRNADAILDFDARDELHKIKSRTLILAGGKDLTVGPDSYKELESGIKNSEVYVYEDLGHGAFEEAKDFYDRVYDWLII